MKTVKILLNILIIIILTIAIIEIAFFSLKGYTRHGEEIVVPDFIGLDCDSIIEQHKDDYNFIMLDSVYSKSYPEGSFYQQDPLPNSNVKRGRNLYYVKVSEAPEMTIMPNLRNLSLRQAMVSLRSNGLSVSELEFVDHFAKNAVVDQKYEGETIEPGTDIVKGAKIKLIVGYGIDDKKTHLPNLLTAKQADVKRLLHEASLNMGNEIYMDNDGDDRYRVYKMNPVYDIEHLVTLGSTVDVWYRSESQFDFESYGRELFKKDSVLAVMKKKKFAEDTIKYVTDSFDYILTHRRFKFDSLSKEYDKNLVFERDYLEYIYRDEDVNIDSIYEALYDTLENDTEYFYYED